MKIVWSYFQSGVMRAESGDHQEWMMKNRNNSEFRIPHSELKPSPLSYLRSPLFIVHHDSFTPP